jgi:hypothetical protein
LNIELLRENLKRGTSNIERPTSNTTDEEVLKGAGVPKREKLNVEGKNMGMVLR